MTFKQPRKCLSLISIFQGLQWARMHQASVPSEEDVGYNI